MAKSSWNAGIIRPVAVAPAGPYQDGAASGVWTIDQATFWTKQGLWPTAGIFPPGNRGLFFGGYAGGVINVIQYVTITTTGNATDFGDLAGGSFFAAGCGSTLRGIIAGGYNSGASPVNVIQYITFATTGDSTDFGDLTAAKAVGAGCNSTTRGVFGGAVTGPSNVIDYITIASVGDATDFGDLTLARHALASCSSSIRGVWAGGTVASNVIDYVTIASVGNATDFGDLLTTNEGAFAGCSSSTRGVFAGGFDAVSTRTNVIVYITIATTGNATDFGDLTEKPSNNAGFSNTTRGVFGGGEKVDPGPSGKTNVITYVTIATTGNATDFGDLISATDSLGGCSSGNGGVQ